MKIGLVSPYGWDTPGGVQVHIRDLANWLIENGHEVSVLAPVSDSDAPREEYLVNAGKPLPIPFNGSVARILFGPIASARVKNWIEENNFDLLHLHEPAIPSLTLLALWAGEGAIVATFHASMEKVKAISAIGGILDPAMEKLTAKIAVSESARATLKERYETEAVVIPNGVAVKRFGSDIDQTFSAKFGARTFENYEVSKEIKVGFLGRFDEPRKGLSIALSAWEKVILRYPKAKFYVAGPAEEKVFRALVEKYSVAVQKSTVFLGRLSDAEKIAFFQGLDIYLAPNTGGESFGIILVEAMAAGAPIIASNLESFAALLQNGVLFENENSPDLAEKIIELIGNPKRRSELGEAGIALAGRYDWDVVGNEILDIYRLAITGNAPVGLSSENRWRNRG